MVVTPKIMDNASVHKGQTSRDVMNRVCLELNPIEEVFAEAKGFLKMESRG